MADYRLKVSTEEVRTKAQQISVQRGNLENLLSEFKTKVASLENCWKSDSGVDYGVHSRSMLITFWMRRTAMSNSNQLR